MKSVLAALMGAGLLAGCVAVPVAAPPPVTGYYYAPAPAVVVHGHPRFERGGHFRHRHRYRGW